jgi:hypothetical protein
MKSRYWIMGLVLASLLVISACALPISAVITWPATADIVNSVDSSSNSIAGAIVAFPGLARTQVTASGTAVQVLGGTNLTAKYVVYYGLYTSAPAWNGHQDDGVTMPPHWHVYFNDPGVDYAYGDSPDAAIQQFLPKFDSSTGNASSPPTYTFTLQWDPNLSTYAAGP